jgi:hypothetical protein
MDAFRPTLSAATLVAGLFLLLGTPAGAQSNVLLLLESGSPAGARFVVDSAGGFVAHGTINRGTIPATGAGERLMWYPRKAALRVGAVSGTQWDDVSIGGYSVATGYNTTASWNYSTAMGYSTTASGTASTAMGYNTTASGNHSTAMGYSASTNGTSGSFVYGDVSTSDTVKASMNNQVTWRAVGGFRISTSTGATSGCSIMPGGGSWVCSSSRLTKENFEPVDGEDVLRRLRTVPVTSWNVIAEAAPGVRHIGPMAQDWHAAFALNDDPLTIHQGDMAGVSLSAVQALDARTRGVPELEREVARLRQENAALRSETAALRTGNTDLEARLARLEALVGRTP